MSSPVQTAMTPGHRAGGLGIDRDDVPVRVLRADDPHVELAREVDVVDEAAASGEERQILQTGNRTAKDLAAAAGVGLSSGHHSLLLAQLFLSHFLRRTAVGTSPENALDVRGICAFGQTFATCGRFDYVQKLVYFLIWYSWRKPWRVRAKH
jgi:hypothetical protein